MMATKKLVGELSDEEILRIARMRVVESGASTFTQVSLDTQLSVERGVIWMIHFIEFDRANAASLTEVAASSIETINIQLTRESKTAILLMNDSDIVQAHRTEVGRSAAIGTDAGPLWIKSEDPIRYNYPLPIPYASQSLFLGILGTDAAATHAVNARIGYSIRQVSDKYFFRVAQALLG